MSAPGGCDCGAIHEHLDYLDCLKWLRARLEEVERSMAEHFQRDHLEGDGPEIDRWKRRLEEVERERDVLDAGHEALLDKIIVLSGGKAPADGGTCACSFDAKDDVCAHHSPMLMRERARAQALAAALDEWGKHHQYCTLVDGYGDVCTCGFDAALAAARGEGA